MSAHPVDDAFAHATRLLASFIAEHRAEALPAMLAALMEWAVMHGVGDMFRSSLANAIKVTEEAERTWKKMLL